MWRDLVKKVLIKKNNGFEGTFTVASEMGIYSVGYNGVSPVNHLDFCQADEADIAVAAAVHEKLGSDLSEKVLKVSKNNLFVVGYDAASQIHSAHFAEGKPARDLASAGHIVVPFRQAAAPVMRPARTMGFAPAMAA